MIEVLAKLFDLTSQAMLRLMDWVDPLPEDESPVKEWRHG